MLLFFKNFNCSRFSFRRLSKLKLHILFWIIYLTIIILYNELYLYRFSVLNWQTLPCIDSKKCSRILLVADPQIIGDKQEKIHYLTPFTIFDSDRYLKKTYSNAYTFVQPDVVIFLGDLMDEAHIATNKEFKKYVRRIYNIFLQSSYTDKSVRYIWLPGDNDIGGEDTIITQDKINRFNKAFSQPNIINVRNVTYFKINRLNMDIPIYKKKREFYSSDIFVGLSHIPMMFKPSPFVDKVFSKMMPQLLFTAHEHKSMIISTDAILRQDFHIVPVTLENNQIFEFTLGETNMYEILIPTCSYRMGTDLIGYGYAIIENKDLRFTVLWSPSRFIQLLYYLIFIVSFFIYVLFIISLKKLFVLLLASVLVFLFLYNLG